MSELSPEERQRARTVLREAEETLGQLERMVRRLETFTDHLDALTSTEGPHAAE